MLLIEQGPGLWLEFETNRDNTPTPRLGRLPVWWKKFRAPSNSDTFKIWGLIWEQNFLTFRDYITWRKKQANILDSYVSRHEAIKEPARVLPVYAFRQLPVKKFPMHPYSRTIRRPRFKPSTMAKFSESRFQRGSSSRISSLQWAYWAPHGHPSKTSSTSYQSACKQRRPLERSVAKPAAATDTQAVLLLNGTDHWIWACQIFHVMPVAQRFKFVRTNGLRYHCLGKGPSIAKCNFRQKLWRRQMQCSSTQTSSQTLRKQPLFARRILLLRRKTASRSQSRAD